MNSETGEINRYSEEDLKKLSKKEKQQTIQVTEEEAEMLCKMPFAKRLAWLNAQNQKAKKNGNPARLTLADIGAAELAD